MAINGVSLFDSNSTSQYHHLKETQKLPRATRRDDRVVSRGYAVGLSIVGLEQTWFFFEHKPPAVAFGRAARMSATVTGWGVYNAAQEISFCSTSMRDVLTLHIQPGNDWGGSAQLSDDDLEKWVAGCNPQLSYWDPRRATTRQRARV